MSPLTSHPVSPLRKVFGHFLLAEMNVEKSRHLLGAVLNSKLFRYSSLGSLAFDHLKFLTVNKNFKFTFSFVRIFCLSYRK